MVRECASIMFLSACGGLPKFLLLSNTSANLCVTSCHRNYCVFPVEKTFKEEYARRLTELRAIARSRIALHAESISNEMAGMEVHCLLWCPFCSFEYLLGGLSYSRFDRHSCA
jgi:hypothetical protein